jgi:hypothetical protein
MMKLRQNLHGNHEYLIIGLVTIQIKSNSPNHRKGKFHVTGKHLLKFKF